MRDWSVRARTECPAGHTNTDPRPCWVCTYAATLATEAFDAGLAAQWGDGDLARAVLTFLRGLSDADKATFNELIRMARAAERSRIVAELRTGLICEVCGRAGDSTICSERCHAAALLGRQE